MMNNMPEYADKEFLDLNLGGIAVKDMTALTFMGWLTNKLDGALTYKADTQELLVAVREAPMSRNMADAEKIRLLRKLLALNIALV